ncbi:MAG TPA: isochorismatase family protein [Syntrophobacteraceae bacterium]|nr:isochorismatase family protein [Syntrophobacteraceae bacterium]
MRHRLVPRREDSLLLVIDIQEAMLKVIDPWEEPVRRTNQLIEAAGILGIPVLATEQYPKGLGPTVPEVAKNLGPSAIFPKEHFSACLEEGFLDRVREFSRSQIVVTGMETHVCVLQTGMDLLANGFQVQVVKNAVASRFREDYQTALDLFRQAGAVVTSAEIVIFQWARRSNTDEFRKILPVVK